MSESGEPAQDPAQSTNALDIGDIPLDAPKTSPTAKSAQDPLSQIPTEVFDSSLLQDFPSHYDGSESASANTHIPVQWVEEINKLRERPNLPIPVASIWPTKGSFYRWCVFMGLQTLHKIIYKVENEGYDNHDPLLNVHFFNERVGGRMASRAEAINTLVRNAKKISEEASHLIAIGEHIAAAAEVDQWLDESRQILTRGNNDPGHYWESLAVKILVHHARDQVRFLANQGYIEDEYVLEIMSQTEADAQEFIDALPTAPEKYNDEE